MQLIEGMLYLKSRRIIHRDLAIRNLLLKDNGDIVIADYGTARLTINQTFQDYTQYFDVRI